MKLRTRVTYDYMIQQDDGDYRSILRKDVNIDLEDNADDNDATLVLVFREGLADFFYAILHKYNLVIENFARTVNKE